MTLGSLFGEIICEFLKVVQSCLILQKETPLALKKKGANTRLVYSGTQPSGHFSIAILFRISVHDRLKLNF